MPTLQTEPGVRRVDRPVEIRRLSATARCVQAVIRVLLAPLATCVWRLRVSGVEHLPRRGAIVVSNHVSYVDAVLLALAVKRPAVFLMQRELFALPVIGWITRAAGVLPIAKGDAPRVTAATLERAASHARGGELVVIFAEGRLTPDGELQRFQRGVTRLAALAQVPIVPAYLSGLWGSWFSRRGGRAFAKLPGVPERVEASFGAPLAHDAALASIESAVAVLAADAATRRARSGANLALLFLRTARRCPTHRAWVDGERSLSYRRAALAALVLSRRIERVAGSGPVIAMLVPTTTGGALATVAVTLAGRTSLHLNPLLGERELAEQLERAGANTLITSRRFLEKLDRRSPLATERGRTLFLEDLARAPSLSEAAWAIAAARVFRLARGARIAATEPATVLYSSGSTARPKAVVLSHANVVANVAAVTRAMRLEHGDRVLDALPLFHSFGYTVALWAPLATGATVLLHPNPLDASGVMDFAARERATVLLGTPSFYQAWLRRADREGCASVRLAVSGAQRLPARLAAAWQERLGVSLAEGYGATELSPVVSVARPGERCRGPVGRPLAGLALRVVDERGESIFGVAGRLWVRGPSVFAGYLDDPELTRQALRDGWYDTGDVARLENDGSLSIVDRVARFSKIGGEMVSHGRVEEALLEALGPSATEVELAVTAVDDGDAERGDERGERIVVVHTPHAFDRERVLARARELGLPRLFTPKADAFVCVSELPRLASGKLDLAALKALARTTFRAARA